MIKKDTLERWTIEKSADIYGIQNWGAGYFDISNSGEIVITPFPDRRDIAVSIPSIIAGMRERGMGMPLLLRVENILDSQITKLHEAFYTAIKNVGYQGQYRGVYPIKVNQQKQVVEKISDFGRRYHYGLEAGSKAELIAALSFFKDNEACLVCNGYKDEEFVDIALYARKMGFKCFIVVEMPSELELIMERSKILDVRPLIGVRIKLASKAGGHWTESGGDRSIFGLNTSQVIGLVDTLRQHDMLDCLQLLHYHLGSQIPNIRDIRNAVLEACRIYTGLVDEGAQMGYLDLGGGLAVDYDGSHTNFKSSRNYTHEEYCADIIETVMATMDEKNIPHPTIVTESGRAIVAYYSLLLFNILDVSRLDPYPFLEDLPKDIPDVIANLLDVLHSVNVRNIQECFNDAIYYRDEIRARFKHGDITLRERSLGENIFWHTIHAISEETKNLKYIPNDLKDLNSALCDIYYANMSVFQSLPDSWAIDHLFPVMPVHRLEEMPTRQGIIADITCDCDGKIDKFIDLHSVRTALPLHDLNENEEYYLGTFLVGAYQETLGDLHNLFGDTNVVSIRIHENGTYDFVKEHEGDSVADILTYVEYDPKSMLNRLRETAEQAVRDEKISVPDRFQILKAYESGLRGYTYYER